MLRQRSTGWLSDGARPSTNKPTQRKLIIKKSHAAFLSALVVGVLMALAVNASVAPAVTVTPFADANGRGTSIRINSNGSSSAYFKNCGSTTLRRKAIINRGYDGTCKSIPGNSTRWLVDIPWTGSYSKTVAC